MERRPELRRSMTLSEQLSRPDPAIREFLKIPDDDSHLSADAGGGGGSGGMINWKPLRDRLRLRRSVNAWSSPSERPSTADGAGSLKNSGSGSNRSHKYIYAQGEATAAFCRTSSLRQTPAFSRAASTRVGSNATIGRSPPVVVGEGSEDESEHDEDEEEGKEEEDAPTAQMSLMALLEQTDSWDEEEEEEEQQAAAGGGASSKNAHAEEEEEDGEGREEEMVHVCCVCMVRHKGAAFIPCGHTFCRLCSRELWVSRGNCPLCNGFIQEILDIF
ncbi:zinc finger CCCH domain-containing protein 15-like [Triticum dicoccoides]|uniref:RING-type domain-containing protein n=1 Tax=Triticum turgidum subsp. durum TaxID=4567 RepID=A0A9R0RN50_TRITD|nr:zinc finger CCCH domain-containing protein 15-like [Triticum dicoccoides]VAH62964.1 unnamed protein product [Triticum turgidum subsp. durum]